MSYRTVFVEGRCQAGQVLIFSFLPSNLTLLASVFKEAGQNREEIDVIIGECRLCIRYGWERSRACNHNGAMIFCTNWVDIVEIANVLQAIADDYPTAPETAFPHLHLNPPFLDPTFQISDIVFEPIGPRSSAA